MPLNAGRRKCTSEFALAKQVYQRQEQFMCRRREHSLDCKHLHWLVGGRCALGAGSADAVARGCAPGRRAAGRRPGVTLVAPAFFRTRSSERLCEPPSRRTRLLGAGARLGRGVGRRRIVSCHVAGGRPGVGPASSGAWPGLRSSHRPPAVGGLRRRRRRLGGWS